MIERIILKKVGRNGRLTLSSLALLFLIAALSLFTLPHTAEAGVPLRVASPGHSDRLMNDFPRYQWSFTGDVPSQAVFDIRSPSADGSREVRRTPRGAATCDIAPFQAPCASLLPVPDGRPALCACAPPGFIPRL